MTNEPTPPSLRILCLHDGKSSAAELHETLKPLDRRLFRNHSVELAYVNSPLLGGKNSGRVWWEQHECNNEQFVGLDASLLHVKQILASMPFSGVLAVGQGAALASLLPFLVDGVGFGIFIHGETLLKVEECTMEDWPVLHIVGMCL